MGKSKVSPPGWGSDKWVFGRLKSILFAKEHATVRNVVLIAFSLVLVGTTLAYAFATTEIKDNKFGMGDSRVDIIENVDPEGPIPWGTDSKNVMLKLVDAPEIVPSLVRAIIVPIVKDASTGNTTEGHFTQLTEPQANQVQMGDIIFHFDPNWSVNWLYKDGYFYYRKVLNAGESTQLLLRGVTLSGSADSSYYTGKQVYIDVYADSVQSQAADDWGLNVDNNGNVTFK